MVSDLLDNLLYDRGQVCCGQQLDELRVFDRPCHCTAGRRHVCTWMFFFDFGAGFPLHISVAALRWVRLTPGVHSLGSIYHVYRHLAMACRRGQAFLRRCKRSSMAPALLAGNSVRHDSCLEAPDRFRQEFPSFLRG
jgi:hypothetical protein